MAILTNSRILTLLCSGMALLALSGCSTTKEDVIPQDGPDMQQIYSEHMRQSSAHSDPLQQRNGLGRAVRPGKQDLRAYTLEAANEIDQVFPLLPNPQMVLYVFPHLSAEGAPVPGYTTAFPLYSVDQYALPGEVYRP
jgi:conjugative transfer region lipoprotein (TIGR03751 family)